MTHSWQQAETVSQDTSNLSSDYETALCHKTPCQGQKLGLPGHTPPTPVLQRGTAQFLCPGSNPCYTHLSDLAMGLLLLLRLDCKSHSWDSLNQWLMLVLDDRFLCSPLRVKIRNVLLLVSRSGSMCKVLRAASPSQSLHWSQSWILHLEESRNSSVAWIAWLSSGNICCEDTLPLSGTWDSQLSVRLTVWSAAYRIFQSLQSLFHFCVELPYSFLDKSSQCESLHTLLLFSSEWGLLAKPLCLHLGGKKAKYRYILFSFLFTSKVLKFYRDFYFDFSLI